MFNSAIIGCGGRGHWHAAGHDFSEDLKLVACADPDEESRRKLAEQFGISRTYADYREMLEQEDLDLVSNCTATGLHTRINTEVAAAGVRAIHSEKPMAPTWGEAKTQERVCRENQVQLTYCHQRRFHLAFVKARQLLHQGRIGQLQRLEASCPNLFDWGTHWFDMLFYYNDDQPAASVIGQLDGRGTRPIFGVPVEGGGLAWIQWQNGVSGLMVTGSAGNVGSRLLTRLVGSEGTIEVAIGQEPILRLQNETTPWTGQDLSGTPFDEQVAAITSKVRNPHNGQALAPEGSGSLHAFADVLAVVDAAACLKSGAEPELSARRALQASELIFATYQSSRRRGQVDLPLTGEDSALLTMLEKEELPTEE